VYKDFINAKKKTLTIVVRDQHFTDLYIGSERVTFTFDQMGLLVEMVKKAEFEMMKQEKFSDYGEEVRENEFDPL